MICIITLFGVVSPGLENGKVVKFIISMYDH